MNENTDGMAKKKKDNRGGPGRGQGRKKGTKLVPYETDTIRVPVPLIPSFKEQIEEFKQKLKHNK